VRHSGRDLYDDEVYQPGPGILTVQSCLHHFSGMTLADNLRSCRGRQSRHISSHLEEVFSRLAILSLISTRWSSSRRMSLACRWPLVVNSFFTAPCSSPCVAARLLVPLAAFLPVLRCGQRYLLSSHGFSYTAFCSQLLHSTADAVVVWCRLSQRVSQREDLSQPLLVCL